MTIEIIVDGQVVNTVTQEELFTLAAEGTIDPETVICVNGKQGKAGQVRGIMFANQGNIHKSIPSKQMCIDIVIDGNIENTVTLEKFSELAAAGAIGPETIIGVNGKLGKARQIKGIVFPNPEDIYKSIPIPEMEAPAPPSVPISVHQPTPATSSHLPTNVTDSDKFYSGLQQNCSNIGCFLTLGGFLLCFLAGFFFVQDIFMGIFIITGRGWLPDEVALILFCIMMGIGGFMVSIGPILLIVSWVLPTKEPEKPTVPKEQITPENEIFSVDVGKLTGCGWLVAVLCLSLFSAGIFIARLITIWIDNIFGFWWGLVVGLPIGVIILSVALYVFNLNVRNNESVALK